MATILIVEDNPANLKLAALLLERAGHRVLKAAGGHAGVELARDHHPDLMLLDIQMPGMDGLEVTRLLRADPATAALRIIALTALTMQGDERRILDAGCDGYIAKPFQYQDFLQRVERALAAPGRGAR